MTVVSRSACAFVCVCVADGHAFECVYVCLGVRVCVCVCGWCVYMHVFVCVCVCRQGVSVRIEMAEPADRKPYSLTGSGSHEDRKSTLSTGVLHFLGGFEQ